MTLYLIITSIISRDNAYHLGTTTYYYYYYYRNYDFLVSRAPYWILQFFWPNHQKLIDKSIFCKIESTCLSNSLVFITALNSIIGYGCLNEWCQIKYAIQIIWNSYDSFVCFLSPEKLANNTQIVYCIKYSNNDCIIGRDIWENGGNFSLIGEVTLGFRWGFYIPYDTK